MHLQLLQKPVYEACGLAAAPSMTIAKLLVEASARNQRCLERMLYELKSIF